MAKELEDILGEKITEGIIIEKRGEKKTKKLEVVEAGHPLPDNDGFEAAKKVVEIAKKARKTT